MNTIIGKEYVAIRDERITDGTITPGMLCQLKSNGNVIAHNRAGGPSERLFALEDDNVGKGITDNYVATDLVKLKRAIPGEEIYAHLTNAGNNIVIGDYMESAGNGKLRKVEASLSSAGNAELPGAIVGVALEAVAIGATARILVRIV